MPRFSGVRGELGGRDGACRFATRSFAPWRRAPRACGRRTGPGRGGAISQSVTSNPPPSRRDDHRRGMLFRGPVPVGSDAATRGARADLDLPGHRRVAFLAGRGPFVAGVPARGACGPRSLSDGTAKPGREKLGLSCSATVPSGWDDRIEPALIGAVAAAARRRGAGRSAGVAQPAPCRGGAWVRGCPSGPNGTARALGASPRRIASSEGRSGAGVRPAAPGRPRWGNGGAPEACGRSGNLAAGEPADAGIGALGAHGARRSPRRPTAGTGTGTGHGHSLVEQHHVHNSVRLRRRRHRAARAGLRARLAWAPARPSWRGASAPPASHVSGRAVDHRGHHDGERPSVAHAYDPQTLPSVARQTRSPVSPNTRRKTSPAAWQARRSPVLPPRLERKPRRFAFDARRYSSTADGWWASARLAGGTRSRLAG